MNKKLFLFCVFLLFLIGFLIYFISPTITTQQKHIDLIAVLINTSLNELDDEWKEAVYLHDEVITNPKTIPLYSSVFIPEKSLNDTLLNLQREKKLSLYIIDAQTQTKNNFF